MGRPDSARWHENGCMRTAWTDSTGECMSGPDEADSTSWDEMAGVGCQANRLGRCVSVNRSGGILT